MTKSNPKRKSTSIPGLKYLITTASLAATIAGWSALANAAQQPTDLAILPTVVVEQAPIIPTLVPLTALEDQQIPARIASDQPVALVTPVVPVSITIAPAPVLRQVHAAPRPVTTTRSSP